MRSLVVFTFLVFAGLVVTGSLKPTQARELTVDEFRHCISLNQDVEEMLDDINDTSRRHSSVVRQANNMSNGPSRNALVDAERNLRRSLIETENRRNRMIGEGEQDCDYKDASYDVFKSACSNAYKLRGSFCSRFDDWASKLRAEKGW